ncbi:hypothetical protein UT300007_34680 [Clostridium sp. CTA-7]
MKYKKKLRLLSFVLTFTMVVSNFFTNFTTLVAKAEELNKNVVIENFEKLKKGNYTEADVELETGSWKFSNAMEGKQEADKRIDSIAARVRSEGFIAMNFDVTNVKEIILSHAYYGNDSGATLKIQKSIDSGVSWVDVGSSNSITKDLKEEKFAINEAGNVRFKINVIGTKDKRINIDNFTIVHNDGTVEQIALTGLSIDESISLEVGGNKGLTIAYIPENTTEKAVEYTSLNPEIAAVDSNGKVTAVKEGQTTVEVKSTVRPNIKATCKVTVTKGVDKVGPTVSNLKPASGQNIGDLRRPEISATFQDETGVDMTSVKLSIDGQIVSGNIVKEGNTIKYLVDKDLSDGAHTVLVQVKDTLGNLTEQEWKFTIGEQKKNLYFGQLHSHTNISDGTGTIDEAYKYAENNAKVDFLAVTDHSNWFDNDKLANISDGSKSEAWKKGLSAADKYNKDGNFVAIYGYEMTWSGSTGGYGHMNTFNTPGFETRTNSKMDLKNYYNTLKTQKQSLSQLNHPGKTFGDFSDFAYYDAEIDKQVTLIEVGNGEGAIRSSGYFPSYEYYTRALDKGWHVAPTNNQDNHKGRWGNANTARTVIEAPNLSRDAVYEAIRERRVYATEDENLKISYEINGNTMGSILGKTDSLDFKVNVEDMDSGDTIKKISIIGDGGKVVKSIDNVNSTTKEWSFTLDKSVSSYYYVRVDQSDRDIAVTSAIWAGDRENVGISTVDSDTEVIVAGEEFNIGTTIYNNEAVAINNVKVEYYLNNGTEAIKTEIIESIASGSTAVAKLPYKFDKAGDYSFQVKVTATVNGVEREFKGAKEVSVLGANEVSKVVIDGAHQNQYVSGDYSGKITTLTALMAQNNVKAVINKEPITDEVLKGASLLILSDPQSKAVTSSGLSPQKYTSDELAAIARFIEKGGNIAITSKADYGDATGEYGNAEQGNSVLKAIGAKIRFNDDQATDDVENGGQNFRLYFNDYNTESSWLNGIDTTKKYSFYSGSTLVMPKDASNIDVLVKGHSTTYGNDADKQGDNTAVNKGEVVGLAVETLSSGAKVVVSGATFFSNFEMDGLDYSNYQITEKVIKELAAAPEIPVSKISSVRIDENKDNTPDRFGETVVVEGYVTAASNVAAPGNSFFDVIYVQDDTAGLTVFGVSTTSVKLGQKVRIKGKVSSYLGDAQVALKNESLGLQIIDENINLVEPTKLSTKDSMLEEKEGLLVKVEGKVTRIDGQNIFVNDGTGESRVYVEGYIGSSKNPGVADEWKTRINVGDKVSAIGLASEDPEGHRLRVRDSAEIENLSSNKVTGVSLDKTSAELEVNETLELKATITPEDATNKEVTWASSDEKVAKVDENGKVTAIGEGKATITVTTRDGNFKATSEITVKAKEVPVVKVTGVSLDKTSAELKVNETLELKATITPLDATNKEVTWASSDGKVAKVDENGKVTAIGEGKATITVTTRDGNFKATSEITVKAKEIPVVKVTGVSLDKTSAELKVNETLELKATITPADATNKEVTWTSSDEKVAKVDENGKVVAVGAGKATITVTTKDGNFKATAEITVKESELPVIKVTGVSLDKTSAELKVNETLELKATITPADATNKEVTWSSSDERVAKVDANGKVTAIGKGKAIITVTTKDGNFKATVEITVKAEDSANGGNTSGSGGNTSGKGGITLPSTGGNNPMYGLIVALIIVGAGAFMVLRKKKKEVKEK